MHVSPVSLRSVQIVICANDVQTMAKSTQRGNPFQMEALRIAKRGRIDMSRNIEQKWFAHSASGVSTVTQMDKYRQSTRNHLVRIIRFPKVDLNIDILSFSFRYF